MALVVENSALKVGRKTRVSKKARNKRRLADMDMYISTSDIKKNPHRGNVAMKKWKKSKNK